MGWGHYQPAPGASGLQHGFRGRRTTRVHNMQRAFWAENTLYKTGKIGTPCRSLDARFCLPLHPADFLGSQEQHSWPCPVQSWTCLGESYMYLGKKSYSRFTIKLVIHFIHLSASPPTHLASTSRAIRHQGCADLWMTRCSS